MTNPDIIVIGAGIAGVSIAAQLSRHAKVLILESETQPAMHATGRSAAYFAPAYGNEVVRDITVASQPFFESPPSDFSEGQLLNKRDALFIASKDQSTKEMLAESPHLKLLSGNQILEQVPIISLDRIDRALIDETGGDLDVDAIVQGYLRMFRNNGGELLAGTAVNQLNRKNGLWELTTRDGQYVAPVVVNSSGAWADHVAQAAGVGLLNIQPCRRTAVLVDAPNEESFSSWPLVVDIDENFYFKPDAGQLLISPADETPSEPCDAQPDELDIAIAIDRVMSVTDLEVRRVNHKWAGLRTFAPDKTFVVGFDPDIEGFFWFAGQGGYGVQSAPGLADIGCHLICGSHHLLDPSDLVKHLDAISPERFR